MSAPLIQLRGIEFAYPGAAPILRGLDFDLHDGERVALLGPNGCGKTTLLHLIVGLLKPSAGEIHAFGRPRRTERDFLEVRRKTALMFQDPDDQLFCPTVAEDVAFGPLNLGATHDQALATVRETLDLLNLAARVSA